LAKKSSFWGSSVSQKIKPYKPKNIAQAAQNKVLAVAAIDQGVCLSFTYEGLHRVTEVHTVGITTAFRPAASVWQIDGQSSTPPIPDWRLFYFDECFDVALTNVPSIAPRSEYKKGAKQFRSIDREI
jgi:hypothetical protein